MSHTPKVILVVLAPLMFLASLTASPLAGAAQPYRILIVGDSISQDLGAALHTQLASSQVTLINDGRPSSGLSNSWFYDWPVRLKDFLATDHPQLVVLLLGANDVRSMEVNGHAAAFNSTPWRAQYISYVDQMINEVTASGARLLWLGAPVMRVPSYSEGLARLNTIFTTQAASHPGVHFVSTWNVLTSAPGRFEFSARVNGTPAQIRTYDGIHPTPLGASVLATYVVSKLHSLYSLPVRAAAPVSITR